MYAKVFSSLWDGSMRGQSDKQLVFIYLLAHADADGVAEIIQGKIADDAGLSEDEVRTALDELMAPDPASRTDSSDGRRLEPLDARGWGWSIVNYQHYRGLRDEDERRRQTREAMSRYRERKAAVSHGEPPLAQGEAEGEAEGDIESKTSSTKEKDDPDKDWTDSFSEFFWTQYPRRVGRPAALKAWRRLKPHTEEHMNTVLDGLAVWAAYWKGKDPEFIPHPATWLNREGWEDKP